MRRLAIAAVAAAVLIGAGPAAAKEVTQAKVCGSDGCTSTKNPTLLQALLDGGPPADPPSHPSGAIRVRAAVSEPGGGIVGHFDTWWVPRTRLLVNVDGLWTRIAPSAAAAIARAARDHTPFPPGRLGASYASPTTPAPPVRTAPAADSGGIDWVVIAVPMAVALLAAGATVLLVRRRPGGATQ